MAKQASFNLIELLTVMVILALLGALAIPRLTEVETGASQTVQDAIKNEVMSAHSRAIAGLKDFPTLIQLETYVNSEPTPSASGKGLRFDIDATGYTVLTYTDAACSTPTRHTTDRVLCIGTVMP